MKKSLIAFLLLVGINVASSRAWAEGQSVATTDTPDPTNNPVFITDSIRGLIGSIMSLIDVGDHPKLGATLNIIQGEVDALVDGDESYLEDAGTGEASSSSGGLTISAYDYVEKHVLNNNLKTPYAPLNSKVVYNFKDGTVSGAEKAIKELFFIAKQSDVTDEKREEIVANRNDYLKKVSQTYVSLAYNVQKSLVDDMSAISADINGNGSIGATAGTDQTWHAINKALVADIALQIQLMELEAARFLFVQPEVIMSEKKGDQK